MAGSSRRLRRRNYPHGRDWRPRRACIHGAPVFVSGEEYAKQLSPVELDAEGTIRVAGARHQLLPVPKRGTTPERVKMEDLERAIKDAFDCLPLADDPNFPDDEEHPG
jgi:hypothetical protein